eukprot:TRINITY_DN8455_c0_g1_i3.p1 TRINITY_DN8455_c0_g1~~TRINITY_DN8455_c0_g1_i3.p1  ORF type:complete len:695 (-),score=172.85 TRINITY_DN8455_c0_g1_i3:347-2431(-)
MDNRLCLLVIALLIPALCFGEDSAEEELEVTVQDTAGVDLKAEKVPLKTDDEVVDREERAKSLDGFSENERLKMQESTEKFQFQAEVNKIMQIIVHSLYSNKEIFVRELVSNASDALDKIRFQALTDTDALGDTPDLEIRIKADKENRTLTISDTGIGMTHEDLINNLGTIAQSGTKAFTEALERGDSSNLIGQFGVGFYSAYLVADKLEVVTKHNDDDQYVWESSSQNSFSISKDPRGNTLGRGTSITLYLKSDADMREEMDSYLEQDTLKGLIDKYSRFIDFPIYMWMSHEEEHEEIVEAEEEEDDEEEDGELELEDEEVEDDGEEDEGPETRTVTEIVWAWEKLNETKPIWLRNKNDVTDEEYVEFYKAIAKVDEEPVTHIHFAAEGDVEFKSILYLPEQPPYGQFDPTTRQRGVKLYVRRVFITDDFDTVIPKYLSFLKGVVDSNSIPLNISREMLQEHASLDIIKKKLIRKAISMFQVLSQDEEKYNAFWKNYGVNIKLGAIEDSKNRSRLSKLLRFNSSTTGELTSFDDYVERMKEGQDQIYFLSGSSLEEIKDSPLLEQLFSRGYEVLMMVDPIDEYVMQNLNKYDSKYKITNVAKEGLKFNEEDEETKDDEPDYDEEFKGLIDFLKTTFSKTISKVKISNRLTSSPAALVAESWGYTATMEKVMKTQALADKRSAQIFAGRRVFGD